MTGWWPKPKFAAHSACMGFLCRNICDAVFFKAHRPVARRPIFHATAVGSGSPTELVVPISCPGSYQEFRRVLAGPSAGDALVRFLWVPNHVGIAGNERASQVARTRSETGHIRRPSHRISPERSYKSPVEGPAPNLTGSPAPDSSLFLEKQWGACLTVSATFMHAFPLYKRLFSEYLLRLRRLLGAQHVVSAAGSYCCDQCRTVESALTFITRHAVSQK